MSKLLGKRLKSLRGKKSQAEVAKALGISRPRYSHYENEHVEPDSKLLIKMSEYFDVSIDYLLGKSADPGRIENNFDPLDELRKYMLENNMQNMDFGFYDIEKWKKLSREDVEDLKKHFDYVYHRAKERDKEGDD